MGKDTNIDFSAILLGTYIEKIVLAIRTEVSSEADNHVVAQLERFFKLQTSPSKSDIAILSALENTNGLSSVIKDGVSTLSYINSAIGNIRKKPYFDSDSLALHSLTVIIAEALLRKTSPSLADEIPASIRQQLSQEGHDIRYGDIRELYNLAAQVARQKWGNGSILPHHKMKDYLIEEYQDDEGQHPFSSDKVKNKRLLQICKEIAREMGLENLISGRKK